MDKANNDSRNPTAEVISPVDCVPDFAGYPHFFEDAYVQDSDAQRMDWISSTGLTDESLNLDPLNTLAPNANTTLTSLSPGPAPALEQTSWWNEIYAIPDVSLFPAGEPRGEDASLEPIIWEDFADFLVEDNTNLTTVQNDTSGNSEQSSLPVDTDPEPVPIVPMPEASSGWWRKDQESTGGNETSRWTFPWTAAMLATSLALQISDENEDPELESQEARTPASGPRLMPPGLDVYDPDDVDMEGRSPVLQSFRVRLILPPSPSSVLIPPMPPSRIQTLPYEVLHLILSYLNHVSSTCLSLTCTGLYTSLQDIVLFCSNGRCSTTHYIQPSYRYYQWLKHIPLYIRPSLFQKSIYDNPMLKDKHDWQNTHLIHIVANGQYNDASHRRNITAPPPLEEDIPSLMLDEDCSTPTGILSYGYRGESSTSRSSQGFQCVHPGCIATLFQSEYLLERHAYVAHSLEQERRRLKLSQRWRHGNHPKSYGIASFKSICCFCPEKTFSRKDALHWFVPHTYFFMMHRANMIKTPHGGPSRNGQERS